MSVQVDAQTAEQFFFEAMKGGWAMPVPKSHIPALPGSKSIPFRIGEYTLLDYYFVAPGSDSSYGTTVIWVTERPFWVMHYGGWYKKEAIPFLKAALRQAYSQNQFVGGRGPNSYHEKGHPFWYRNHIENFANSFARFHGFEDVVNTENDEVLGEHRFFGGLLA
ncbi:MAG: hypothetical protein HYS78_01695 [Parcubacteria group bacterium]|nr:hypothetical protein [Parcubacteria group bacterium]